jgi:hypothetical protein
MNFVSAARICGVVLRGLDGVLIGLWNILETRVFMMHLFLELSAGWLHIREFSWGGCKINVRSDIYFVIGWLRWVQLVAVCGRGFLRVAERLFRWVGRVFLGADGGARDSRDRVGRGDSFPT